MMKPPDPHYRHRFPAELISHAVWLYHVFSLSFRDVELILAERGVVVSYESIRQWCLKFGASFADKLRRRRPRPGDKWYLDEVFIRIQGELHYLWRAVDQDGIVLDILVQHRRDAGAAKRFFKRLEGVCAAGPRHRQARQLRRGEARVDARRRTPQEPLPEQSSGELASTNSAPRTADAALQVGAASATLPIRTRLIHGHFHPQRQAKLGFGHFLSGNGRRGLSECDVLHDAGIESATVYGGSKSRIVG
jgi:putative transposase